MRKTDPHPSCSWGPGSAPQETRPPKPGLLSLRLGGPSCVGGRAGVVFSGSDQDWGAGCHERCTRGTSSPQQGRNQSQSQVLEGTAASAPGPLVHGVPLAQRQKRAVSQRGPNARSAAAFTPRQPPTVTRLPDVTSPAGGPEAATPLCPAPRARHLRRSCPSRGALIASKTRESELSPICFL